MSAPHDEYLALGHAEKCLPCPCCGGDAEVWQFSESGESPTTKVVMCKHGNAIGPQDGITNEGCMLYMPPNEFYRPTIREAINYWNEFAKALQSLQRTNRWARARATR